MTILVGYPTKRRAKAVLNLAGMLARSDGGDLVICAVIRDPRVPGVARNDPNFRDYADELADTALAQARLDAPTDVEARYLRIDTRTIASGLIQAAEDNNAGLIVVGSAMGRVEAVTVSSVADRLLHSSPVPVAVATRGYRAGGERKRRVTLAFASNQDSVSQVAAAEALAAQYGAELRLTSFLVNTAPLETARAHVNGPTPKQLWTRIIRKEVEMAVAADAATARRDPEIVIGEGREWAEALDEIDWRPGDLLVVGSSEAGPLSRVFLGSHATKIIRNIPVPVIALPPRRSRRPRATMTPPIRRGPGVRPEPGRIATRYRHCPARLREWQTVYQPGLRTALGLDDMG